MRKRIARAAHGFLAHAVEQRNVWLLLAAGGADELGPEIARQLDLSPQTVEAHRRNLMRKLAMHSIADLTRYAIREGLIRP